MADKMVFPPDLYNSLPEKFQTAIDNFDAHGLMDASVTAGQQLPEDAMLWINHVLQSKDKPGRVMTCEKYHGRYRLICAISQ